MVASRIYDLALAIYIYIHRWRLRCNCQFRRLYVDKDFHRRLYTDRSVSFSARQYCNGCTMMACVLLHDSPVVVPVVPVQVLLLHIGIDI